ncbi:MAG: ATP-dependent metallopeptidase FtsH/Yme1/Tma family protein, partial [bacterium]
MNRAFRNMGFYLLLIIIALSVINYYANEPAQVEEIAYSTFLAHLEAGEVDRVIIVDGAIEGEFKNGEKFTTYNPNDGKLVERLEQAGVTYTGEP